MFNESERKNIHSPAKYFVKKIWDQKLIVPLSVRVTSTDQKQKYLEIISISVFY